MSKAKGTTKIATFVSFWFSNGEEVWPDEIRQGNAHDCVGAETTSGHVAGWNGFTTAIKGDRVVLRKGAPCSYSSGQGPHWVMTNQA